MNPSINRDKVPKKAQEAEKKAGEGFDFENDLMAPEEDGDANKTDPQAIFDVYVYDPHSGKAKMEKYVTVGSFKNVQRTKMSNIRQLLRDKNALSFRLQGASFCNKVGAVANEDLPFADYIMSLDRGMEKSEGNTGEKSNKLEYSLHVPTESEQVKEPQVYAVYFKSRALPTEADDATREFLQEKLDLELRKADLNGASKPDILRSSYNHSGFMAGVSKGTVVHPADMSQGQWNIVMQTNALLHGSYVRLPRHGISKKVERAMHAAFKLKPRQFYDFEASMENKDIPTPKKEMIIPRYRVEDDAYVEVSENQSSVSWAIASSSLSELAAEVAVGSGIFGYSAGAKAGFKNEDKISQSEANVENTKRMTITYNFPRVVLQLDEDSLQLSDECTEALKYITDKASIEAFKSKYGYFFATRVELGGRLHATEDSAAMGNHTASERARAMKAAASLSFSSPFVQASASSSLASSKAESDDRSKSSLNMSMTWEAKGGDTLLCNNPPAWCSTVASFYNWRVVKQENLLAIEDLISRIPDHQGVKEKFDRILKDSTDEPVIREKGVSVSFKAKGYPDKYITFSENPQTAIAELCNSVKTDSIGRLYDVMKWKEENHRGWKHLYFWESLTSGVQVFQLDGTIDFSESKGSKGRIRNGAIYTPYCAKTKSYIHGTPRLVPEFDNSLLHEGDKEVAWSFQVMSVNPLREPGTILQPGEEVYLNVCEKGISLGRMSHMPSNILGVGEKGDTLTFSLEYKEA